jgi:hypothetical protein
MTQWAPMDPFSPDDRQGIPAADPGAGAPPQAPGYGPAGEEPDRPAEVEAPAGEDTGADEDTGVAEAADGADGGDPPFRTPDPDDVSRRG